MTSSKLLEALRFADGFADLVVNHQMRAQTADAFARSADHREEHAHAGDTARLLNLVERRFGEAKNPGVSRGDCGCGPGFLVHERHFAEIIPVLEHGEGFARRTGRGSALLDPKLPFRMKYMLSPGSPSAKTVSPSP